MSRYSLLLIGLVLSSCTVFAQGLRVTLPANAESAWIVVHLKDGGTQSWRVESGGKMTDEGVMTRGEHEKAAAELRISMERWQALKESYAIAGDSKPAVIKYLLGLQELNNGALASIGIADGGKYRPLTADDLKCAPTVEAP